MLQSKKSSPLLLGLGCLVIVECLGWSRLAEAQTSGLAGRGTPPLMTPGVPLPPAAAVVASTQAAPTTTPNTTGWAHVPGALVNPDCVHEVPNRSTVKLNGDITLNGAVVAHYDACPTPPVYTRPVHSENQGRLLSAGPGTFGWVEEWSNNASSGTQYEELTTDFTVPSNPTTECDGQLIYLFPGQEPQSQDMILQPVVQWGTTTAGGTIGSCTSWTYAAWEEAPSGQFFHSSGITVAAGDVLWGGEGFIGASGNEELWVVEGEDTSNTGLGEPGILVEASTSEVWTWAYAAVLETEGSINQSNCNDWPGGSSGVNFWTTPTILNQNGTSVSPTFSACAEAVGSLCAFPAYTGTNCDFIADTYGTLFDLFF